MAREIVTSENLRQFVDKKMAKKPIAKAEETKPKTPPEKSRYFDKIKNEMGLIDPAIQKKLDKIKNDFMAGKIDELEIKEALKIIGGGKKEPNPKEEQEIAMNSMADIANKKI